MGAARLPLLVSLVVQLLLVSSSAGLGMRSASTAAGTDGDAALHLVRMTTAADTPLRPQRRLLLLAKLATTGPDSKAPAPQPSWGSSGTSSSGSSSSSPPPARPQATTLDLPPGLMPRSAAQQPNMTASLGWGSAGARGTAAGMAMLAGFPGPFRIRPGPKPTTLVTPVHSGDMDALPSLTETAATLDQAGLVAISSERSTAAPSGQQGATDSKDGSAAAKDLQQAAAGGPQGSGSGNGGAKTADSAASVGGSRQGGQQSPRRMLLQ